MNQRFFLWTLISLCILLLTACASPTAEAVEIYSTLQPPSVTATVANTNTSTPTPTSTTTAEPSATPTVTLTPSPTITRHPPRPLTPPPPPAYTLEEQQAFLEMMLATNGGCDFPCWWGITPGETSWQDFLTALDTWQVAYTEIGYGVKAVRRVCIEAIDKVCDQRQPISYVVFHPDAAIEAKVQSIEIAGQAIAGRKDNGFPMKAPTDYLMDYNLPGALSRYGPPVEVKIRVARDAFGIWKYKLVLLYPDTGLAFEYSGEVSGTEGDFLACAAGYRSYTTRVFFLPPDSDLFVAYQSAANNYSEWQGTWSTVSAPTRFYQAFYQPEPSACIRWLANDNHNLNKPTGSLIVPIAEQDALPALIDNAPCPLPCWHGITPMETNALEAQTLFQTLSPATRIFWHTNDRRSYNAEVLLRFSDTQLEYLVEQYLVTEGEEVPLMQVTAKLPSWSQGSDIMQAEWQPYMLSEILQHHGTPDKVQVHLPYITCETKHYALRLFYTNAGFAVVYKSSVQRNDDGTLTICPATDSLYRIELHTRSSDAITEWADTPIHEVWPEPDIDETTFTETYANPAETACLTLPLPNAYTCP